MCISLPGYRQSHPFLQDEVEEPIRLEYLDMVYGDKNIYSTPEDMLKWDAALRGRDYV